MKWAEYTRAIDKGHMYVFSVLNKKFDLDPIMGYLSNSVTVGA